MKGIARRTDYASRIVLHLVGLGSGARVQIQEIAARRLLPAPFVRRVVAQLSAAGILQTVRGTGGGVSLARPPKEISLLDVVQAIEGGIVLNQCTSNPQICPLASTCPVQRAWVEVTSRTEDHLASITFADLLTPQEIAISEEGYPDNSGSGTRRQSPPSAQD
jgi:Rrf2 family protein